MEIGIFAKTFVRPTLEAVLDSVTQSGLTKLQFNMSCVGLSTFPDFIDPVISERIHREADRRNIEIVAVSGTFNMIHPDKTERQIGLRRLKVLAAACKDIGTSMITLCTGTRDPNDMWMKHIGNADSEAWLDLLETMEEALGIAEEYNVTLAFEPEQANVVDSAEKGRKLLREAKSPNLKVVMDAANLFQMNNLKAMRETMDKAFHLLGDDIVIAHAKDIRIKSDGLEFVAAGEGILDYDTYLKLLKDYQFSGALILHGMEEKQVPASVHFIKQKLHSIH